jgi:hypothetical protein
MSSKTQFPDDVFHLIKSFTKPKLWCCDSCDEEFNMKEQQPEYIDGFDLSVKPVDGFVPICQECISSRKCSMCWELSYCWKDCLECDERYCEDCFNGVDECPNCFESDESDDDE